MEAEMAVISWQMLAECQPGCCISECRMLAQSLDCGGSQDSDWLKMDVSMVSIYTGKPGSAACTAHRTVFLMAQHGVCES